MISNQSEPAIHPAMTLPLYGVHVLEASAGTGKTYSLALLYLRLLIERKLDVRQVLAVTFTDAAAAELRERIRIRLRDLLRVAIDETSDYNDPVLSQLITHALANGETRSTLIARMTQQLRNSDMAAVFTIHGWCRRLLSDHALDFSEPLLSRKPLTSIKAFHRQLASDAWRFFRDNKAMHSSLSALWADPDTLAADMQHLLSDEPLNPTVPEQAPDIDDKYYLLDQSTKRLYDCLVTEGVQAKQKLLAAVDKGYLNKRSYTEDAVNKRFQLLTDALEHAIDYFGIAKEVIDAINFFSNRSIIEKLNKAADGVAPTSTFFDACSSWLQVHVDWDQALRMQYAWCVHQLRLWLKQYSDSLLAQREEISFDAMIRIVAQRIADKDAITLRQKLRAAFPVALVDEFQDTDALQWSIFDHIHGHRSSEQISQHADNNSQSDQAAPALFLIGDPKQAIYGFRGGDVHTYLQATSNANTKGTLTINYRSRPDVLAAIENLFDRDDPFQQPGIDFVHVQPCQKIGNDDFLLPGKTAPALQRIVYPSSNNDVDSLRKQAASHCAAVIRDLLDPATTLSPQLRINKNQYRRPCAQDVAVLVFTHTEAALMRDALSALGISAVTSSRASVMASDEAMQLLWLLEAALNPDNESAVRLAHSTLLIGADANMLDRWNNHPSLRLQAIDQARQWQLAWFSYGPLAMIQPLVAQAAPRLLQQTGGTRALSNYLQIAQWLQAQQIDSRSAHRLIDQLRSAISLAGEDDDTHRLYLESDQPAVKIVTVHAAKGLEFPFVMLPFSSIEKRPASGKVIQRIFDDGQYQLYLQPALDEEYRKHVKAIDHRDQLAEALRVFYVAVTRAQYALWIGMSDDKPGKNTALGWLLDNRTLTDITDANSVDLNIPITIEKISTADAFATPKRNTHSHWWVHSFSQLTRGNQRIDERGGEDETPPRLVDNLLAGAHFGTTLHTLLETTDFALWRDPVTAVDLERPRIEQALRASGITETETLNNGTDLLVMLIRQTLTVPMPEGVRLCDLPDHARRAELEFHLSLAAGKSQNLLKLLHQHGIALHRHSFLGRDQLEGLLTGKIDLVYEYDNRIYIIDYKSNYLTDYSASALVAAMQNAEYDLQYVLYTFAVHRWLRFKRGDHYDYSRDFGGVRYLFCRGLDTNKPNVGLFATQPSAELIKQLDHFFSHTSILDA